MTRAAYLALFVSLFAPAAACGDADGGTPQVSQVDADNVLTGDALCRAVGDPCADEGAAECTEAGLRVCRESLGCLQWTAPTSCPAGTGCDAGRCVPACPGQPCSDAGARRCDPTDAHGVLTCGDQDQDGCLDFGGKSTCPDGGFCNGGICGATCADECALGARKCEGDAVVTCGEFDGDGCLEWGVADPCPGACAIGSCVDSCVDECAAADLDSCDGDGVRRCTRGGDGCLHWGTTVTCAQGSTCSGGVCATTCLDECSQPGTTACDGGGRVTCGQHDGDTCLEWSLPEPCGSGTSCSDGTCAATCADECTTLGATTCDATGHAVRQCGQYDADPCLEWQAVVQCNAAAGETCSAGACSAVCVDECVAQSRRCKVGTTTRLEVCGNDDADACLEWVAAPDCGNGQVCQDGACVASCQDDCQAATCVEGAVVSCGQYDADTCLDFGTPAACPAHQRCVAGVCATTPPPAGRLISELLYNAVGDDIDVFIEVHGPAGESLVGFSLVAVNGYDGAAYATIPLTGSLSQAGYYVVAHPSAAPWIRLGAQQLDAAVDLQNGPDNLQLRFGDQIVDAIGYGTFVGNDRFVGEGTPHPGALSGHSLARDESVGDTGNNATDFKDIAAPTPGRATGGSVRPTVAGQLLVTEFMADPSTLSDSAGEWFELYNPSATATYRIDDCVLTDGDNDAHVIDALLEVPPLGSVTLARSASPGFTPTYVYEGFVLNNGGDSIFVECDGIRIASVGWTGTVPSGIAWNRDPASFAQTPPPATAWCAASASYNGDLGTPNATNSACAAFGSYTQTLAATGAGSCPEAGAWQEFQFSDAPVPAGAGELDLEWVTALCVLFGSDGALTVQLQTGATWTNVIEAYATSASQSCAWLSEGEAVPLATLTQARTGAGLIKGRFKIVPGCSADATCGSAFQPAPTNCARKLALTFPWD